MCYLRASVLFISFRFFTFFSFLFFFFCFVSFLTILFSFFCVSFFLRFFSLLFSLFSFRFFSFRFFSFLFVFFRFSVYRYPNFFRIPDSLIKVSIERQTRLETSKSSAKSVLLLLPNVLPPVPFYSQSVRICFVHLRRVWSLIS